MPVSLSDLPVEILNNVLLRVFDSEIIYWELDRTNTLETSQVQPWHLDIIQVNRRLHSISCTVLHSAISQSTVRVRGRTLDDVRCLKTRSTSAFPATDASKKLTEQFATFLHHYSTCIHKLYIQDAVVDFASGLSPFPALLELHVNQVQAPEFDRDRAFTGLVCSEPDIEIEKTIRKSWRHTQAWIRHHPSWYTIFSTGPFSNSSFCDLLKTESRNVNVFIHWQYESPLSKYPYGTELMLEVVCKLARYPLKGDGMEVVSIWRDKMLADKLNTSDI